MERKEYEGQVIVGERYGSLVEYYYDNDPDTKRVMSAKTFDQLPQAPAW